MTTDKKQIAREVARWIRVGTLALTVVGPIINTLRARVKAQAEAQRPVIKSATTLADTQQKLIAVGSALNEALDDLKHNPYGQDLRRRGEDVASELIERGNRLSQRVIERSNQITSNVAKRSSELTQDLAERGNQVSETITQRGREVAERSNPLVLLAGFLVGLAVTAISVYLIIRKRMQSRQLEDDAQIELPNQGSLTGSIEGHFVPSAQTTTPQAPTRTPTPIKTSSANGASAAANVVPADAVLVGVVNTRRYYPIETPLEQLETADSEPLDIVYFTSEEEAKTRGFSAVE